MNQTVKNSIFEKLQSLKPAFLQVDNESYMHNVPDGSETHFKVTMVCDAFQGKMLLARHRKINELLSEQLENKIHALSLHTFTPEEWFRKQRQTQNSPQCMSGSKH